jgi:hypothetical protein
MNLKVLKSRGGQKKKMTWMHLTTLLSLSMMNCVGHSIGTFCRMFIFRRVFRLGVFATVATVLLMARAGHACVCRGAEEPPCLAYHKASAVFVGKVTKFTSPMPKEQLVHFSIEQAFKGVTVGNPIELSTRTDSDCNVEFKIGTKYFVYAYEVNSRDRLTTDVCTRTQELSSAKADLEYVHEVARFETPTLLLGRDGTAPSSLLAGSDVIVEGRGQTLKAVIDKEGAFRIALSGPGSYRITIIAPAGLELVPHYTDWTVFVANGRPAVQFDRTFTDGRCEFVDFSLWLTVIRRN